jgi:hypothetical protein
LHALKNLELAHYVDHLQDENDELRKLIGWLSGHEPQLRIMIETFKRQDGEGLGANKVGECRMDLPGPTTSVGTGTDYSVGPWDYPTCAARYLMAWGARTTVKYSDRKLYIPCTV